MAQRNVNVSIAALSKSTRADVLFVPVPTPGGRPAKTHLPGLDASVAAAVSAIAGDYYGSKEVGAIDDQIIGEKGPFRRVALVGLGKDEIVTPANVRTASAMATAWCDKHRVASAVVAADPLLKWAGDTALPIWAEAALLAGFRYEHFRANLNDDSATRLKELTLAITRPSASQRNAVAAAAVLAECVNLARTYGHEPPNVINPVTLARAVQAEAKHWGLTCRVLDETRLAALKMNALLAVGRGSASPPRLIVLEHNGAPRSAKSGKAHAPVALVGKAVTHDTGGYAIKPYETMVEMKYDKCGGMAVLGTMIALARLKLPVNVVGIIAAAENMISGEAYRPSDILTAMNGKTIEVTNTDAEGRLVLADALHYAERFHKPRAMIDLATLTGACVVALGHHAAGLFSNRDDLADALLAAGEATGDRLWRMPLWPDYRKQIEGTDSDLKNTGGRPGGSITAATFLKEFVSDKTPWAHLDIAGVAYSDKDAPICPKGATGFGVRLLVNWLQNRIG